MIKRVCREKTGGVYEDCGSSEPWAAEHDWAIGEDPDGWPDEIPGGRLIVRCGREDESVSPMRWMGSGWEAFDRAVGLALGAAEQRGIELLICPSLLGMLSDAVSTMSWARRMGDAPIRIFLDPVGWLSGSMINDAEDHLTRMVEMMGGCEKIAGVLVRASSVHGDLDAAMVGRVLGPLIAGAPVVGVLDGSDLGVLDHAD